MVFHSQSLSASCLLCFLSQVSRELFNPEFALFRTAPADRNRLFPNLNSDVNPGHLSYFRFCGRFIALAIAHEMPLGITLCSALADGLLRRQGQSPGGKSMGHFAARDIDPELFESCERLLQLPESEVSSECSILAFYKAGILHQFLI